MFVGEFPQIFRERISTYQKSPKDNKEEGGNAQQDLGDINLHVDEGEHAVIENHGDAIVEEGLAKYEEVETGIHLIME